ncbi:MAG TPA: TIGR03118 family protein [Vicinamibacteria bacterium]
MSTRSTTSCRTGPSRATAPIRTSSTAGASRQFVTDGTFSGAGRFIFASEDGKIRGWNPNVPPGSTVAQVGADRSGVGAIYKGLTIASTTAGNFLYAADFHNARVDMFDRTFQVVTPPGAFVDPRIPAGYAPFGIQNLGGRIYVTCAKQDAAAEDEIAGQGRGFVSVFSTSGEFLERVATHGQLDAPWGLAFAPAGFDKFSGDLLVGNFGNGRINAYEPQPDGTFELVGPLRGHDNRPLEIDGLWGIGFGNGNAAGPTTTLFFAAGPGDEEHGLFGKVEAG